MQKTEPNDEQNLPIELKNKVVLNRKTFERHDFYEKEWKKLA